MADLKRVMIIRHGEKPLIKNQAPFGVTADGEQDWESLTVRGWQRAGALAPMFASALSADEGDSLSVPSVIYVSKPRDPGATSDDTGSKSKRPTQTITPLAAKLGVDPNEGFGAGAEDELAEDVLKQQGVVLICWQHEAICQIASAITASGPPETDIPSKWPGERFDVIWVFDPPGAGGGKWKFFQVLQQLLPGDGTKPIS